MLHALATAALLALTSAQTDDGAVASLEALLGRTSYARRLEQLEAEVGRLRGEAQKAQAETQELQRRLAKLEGRQLSTRRRSQQSGASSSLVHIHRVNITLHGPGAGYSSGHRRAQQGCGDVATRISRVNHECCDGPGEDCSSGVPVVCNAGCAAEFLPFWNDCSGQLQNS